MSSVQFNSVNKSCIKAILVPCNQRANFLPKYFGKYFVLAEQRIYGTMEKLAEKYQGGYWDFFELSNGGFYMAPTDPEGFDICVAGNWYEGFLSSDAAGIVICLWVINELWCDDPSNEQMAEQYHLLRDFAGDHVEANKIFSALD